MSKCLRCGKETGNPKFCSRSCAAIFNNTGKQKNFPKERICQICGASFFCSWTGSIHRSKTKCRECYKKTVARKSTEYYKGMTIDEYNEKSKANHAHRSSINAFVRGFNRSWNRHMTRLPCAICGYDKYVELAHIKPVTSFSGSATIGKINHPSNVIQLCPNCHWEFDHDMLTVPNTPGRI